jgi:hypothetical protein
MENTGDHPGDLSRSFLRLERVTRVHPTCVESGHRGWDPNQALSRRSLLPLALLLSIPQHTTDVPPPRPSGELAMEPPLAATSATAPPRHRQPLPRARRPNPSLSRLIKFLLRAAPRQSLALPTPQGAAASGAAPNLSLSRLLNMLLRAAPSLLQAAWPVFAANPAAPSGSSH